MTILIIVAGVIGAVAALLLLWRLIAGPTLIDRLIASDVLLTTLILVVGAEMVVSGHTRSIPLMVVLAATGILGSVAVARFVSRAGAEPGTAPTAQPGTAPRGTPTREEGDDG